MIRLQLAGLWAFSIGATTVNLTPIGALLAVLGGLGGLAAFLLVGSQRTKNTVDAMSVLFDKQREINKERLEVADDAAASLREQLAAANGDRENLSERLKACNRERALLRDQIRGLDLTIEELQRSKDKDKKGSEPA